MFNSQNNGSDFANPLYAASPFTVASAYNIETGKVETVNPITAAPERGKTSAATPTKKPRARKVKPSQPAAEQPTSPAPDKTEKFSDTPAPKTEAEVLAYIDSLDAAEQAKFFQLADIVRKVDGRATQETPAVTLDPEPEPTPEPADEDTFTYKDGYHMPDNWDFETIYDRPYHEAVRHGHIRTAWAVYGVLVATAQVSMPDMRDQRWADNLECTLNIIADTLAQHGH